MNFINETEKNLPETDPCQFTFLAQLACVTGAARAGKNTTDPALLHELLPLAPCEISFRRGLFAQPWMMRAISTLCIRKISS